MNTTRYSFILAVATLALGAGCVATAGDDSTSTDSEEEQSDQASEASSSGCTSNECIKVQGTKLYVKFVESSYMHFPHEQSCSRHHLHVTLPDGSLWLSRYSPRMCVYDVDMINYSFWLQRNLPENAKVCTTFAGHTACETVHS